jgi:SpoVK/Ycf46/Vps4 family AAA+-type ATPase
MVIFIAALDVDSLREIKARKNGFEDLELPSGHKDVVQALVQTHFRRTGKKGEPSAWENEEQFDLVRDKGKGLIILLHGAPGVGKTSTAECVAESNNVPLLPITCGDLGITAQDVERKLEMNFRLAQAWGCVLLLDEADVFLAQRTSSDLERNAVVSG